MEKTDLALLLAALSLLASLGASPSLLLAAAIGYLLARTTD
jgi:hypothetical protein